MTAPTLSPATKTALGRIAAMHEACGDPARLRLLNLLTAGELCVCDLVDLTAQSQPFVSRHLARLRAAGLVDVARKGKFAYYRLMSLPSHAQRQLDAILDGVHAADAQLRRERDRAATRAAKRGATPCE
ncbi:MAG: winged helix-turn-helix transcriptional regulator [Gemmatimonadaceae bacterium]|nr:winged helix-turn-helix transcriptional regulator [Gemmatimonadaceae bacterium]